MQYTLTPEFRRWLKFFHSPVYDAVRGIATCELEESGPRCKLIFELAYDTPGFDRQVTVDDGAVLILDAHPDLLTSSQRPLRSECRVRTQDIEEWLAGGAAYNLYVDPLLLQARGFECGDLRTQRKARIKGGKREAFMVEFTLENDVKIGLDLDELPASPMAIWKEVVDQPTQPEQEEQPPPSHSEPFKADMRKAVTALMGCVGTIHTKVNAVSMILQNVQMPGVITEHLQNVFSCADTRFMIDQAAMLQSLWERDEPPSAEQTGRVRRLLDLPPADNYFVTEGEYLQGSYTAMQDEIQALANLTALLSRSMQHAGGQTEDDEHTTD